MMVNRSFTTALIAGCLFVSTLSGARIIDPPGDFLPTYTGPANGDLDILEAEVFYDPADMTFRFTSTSNVPIGTTPSGVFVWGVNRGAGFFTFPGLAAVVPQPGTWLPLAGSGAMFLLARKLHGTNTRRQCGYDRTVPDRSS